MAGRGLARRGEARHGKGCNQPVRGSTSPDPGGDSYRAAWLGWAGQG